MGDAVLGQTIKNLAFSHMASFSWHPPPAFHIEKNVLQIFHVEKYLLQISLL